MDPVSKARISGNRGTHENSLANLRKFEPGVSGNPSGRPKKSLLLQAYEDLANDEAFVAEATQATKQRLLSPRMVGTLESREFFDRVEGKTVEKLEISGHFEIASVIEQRRKKRDERTGQP